MTLRINLIRCPLVIALSFFGTLPARADEAVTHQGRRFIGTLRTDDFLIEGSNKSLALAEIQYVRFPEHRALPPHCRLLHQLLLAGGQKLVGELRSVSAGEVEFDWAGNVFDSLKLPRERVVGIVQADGQLLQFADNLDKDNGSFRWVGKPVFGGENELWRGRLRLSADSQDLELRLPPSKLSAWQARLRFYNESVAATIEFRLQAKKAEKANVSIPLTLNAKDHLTGSVSRILLERKKWHMIQLDAANDEAKLFVDDYLLGRSAIPRNAQLASIRLSQTGSGSLWLGEFLLTARTPPPARTPGPPDLDEIWLATGDQVFGSIISADERAIIFNARFGKRTFPWKSVRGMFFGKQAKSAKYDVTVRIRSGPGVRDVLNGSNLKVSERSSSLRHDSLSLRHELLGDIGIKRTLVEEVRFPEKAAR